MDMNRILVEDGDLIARALKEGVRDAMLCHKRDGFPVVIDRDGKIVWVKPEDLGYYQKALHRLRSRGRCDARLLLAFLRYWTETGVLANFVTQTGIAHLVREKLVEVPLQVPEGAEQTAIATVLSDIDAEMVALEQRLAKTRALKQGMMQELLTGRTRLVAVAGA